MSGNSLIRSILVVSNPIGIPSKRQLKKCSFSTKSAKFPAKIASPVPIVKRGPNARKIDNSPKPLLATSLRGGAV